MNMNKFVKQLSLVMVLLSCVMSPPVLAADMAEEGTVGRKFQRGLLNVLLSPMELTKAWNKEEPKKRFDLNWLTALPEGVVKTMVRFTAGAFEVITAPVPIPHKDKRPLLKPEFPWELLESSPKKTS